MRPFLYHPYPYQVFLFPSTRPYRTALMRSVSTEIYIAATPQAVWSVLTDLGSYPSWNPFIRKLEGEVRQGAPWKMVVSTGETSSMKFDITLTSWTPDQQLTWIGGMFTPRLFASTHDFRLSEVAGGTRLLNSETFSGLLIPLLFPFLKATTEASFVRMNEALKAEVAQRQGLLVAGQSG